MTLLVTVLGLLMAIRVANMETCFFASTRVMNNARTAAVQAVFTRAVSKDVTTLDVGKWSNLMSTDADKFGKMS